MLIAMAGLPGSGKSTIAQAMAEKLGYPVVSVDPIESAILSAGIAAEQPTGLAAYLVADTIADAVLSSGTRVIIDAVNAVAPAREQWVELAAKHAIRLRFVEVVCSDPAVHRARLEARSRFLPHVTEPTWFAVEQSLDEYEPWIGASGAVERITIDSMEPLEAIVERAIAFVEA